ncbi:MAG: PaaI family thioesterase [Desulfatiglans sp.]|jgi:acyl-coenzyme A thioesterase PaaI-like protein|nr:PaaI family thioesterase [Desulfatiglans sp.]
MHTENRVTKANKLKIKKPEGYFCFACGTANPIGLNLEFFAVGNKVITETTLNRYHVGWSDIAHGGIISTILDEVMSWTILYIKRCFFVTRKLEIKYIKPVKIGVPLIASGSILTNSEDDKIVKATGELRDNHNSLLAKASGEFIIIPREDIQQGFKDSEKEIFSLIDGLEKTEKR